MRHPKPNHNRRRFLRSSAILGVVSTFLPRNLVQGERPLEKHLHVKRDALGTPRYPRTGKMARRHWICPNSIHIEDPSQQSDKFAVAKQQECQP